MKRTGSFQVKLVMIWMVIVLSAAPIALADTNYHFSSSLDNSAGEPEKFHALPDLPRQTDYVDSSVQIVIDKRTGEIIKGNMLLLGNGKVTCDNLHLDILESKPTMYSSRMPAADTTIQPVTLGQVVTALLTLSVKPAEIIDILKSLIQKGVLQAELIVQ